MIAVTRYQSKDGVEFSDPESCAKHESLCDEVDAVMANLPAVPDLPGCGFHNGGGYIQHDPTVFWQVRNELLKIALRLDDHKWLSQSLADPSIDPMFAARIISDGLPKPLSKAWWRICCIDMEAREWGQPYFRNNPKEATNKKLN